MHPRADVRDQPGDPQRAKDFVAQWTPGRRTNLGRYRGVRHKSVSVSLRGCRRQREPYPPVLGNLIREPFRDLGADDLQVGRQQASKVVDVRIPGAELSALSTQPVPLDEFDD